MPITWNNVQLLLARESLGEEPGGFGRIEFVVLTPNDERGNANRPDTTDCVDKKCRRGAGQRKGAECFEDLGPGEPSVDFGIGGNMQFTGELQQGNLPI